MIRGKALGIGFLFPPSRSGGSNSGHQMLHQRTLPSAKLPFPPFILQLWEGKMKEEERVAEEKQGKRKEGRLWIKELLFHETNLCPIG